MSALDPAPDSRRTRRARSTVKESAMETLATAETEAFAREGEIGRLRLTDIVKEFGQGDGTVRAVDDLELDIEPGEFVTLLGPSGCGKTTTLRMIAGFEEPTSGHIYLDDEDIVVQPPNKRPMAMVFQSYALFPHLSVRENVAYGLKLRRLPADRLAEEVDLALTSMNLLALAGRAPNQLSGGQQQRVALARAMVMKPKVLLFDEPLSNLDAKLRVQMRLEIRRLQKRLGITSVYVTHDQSEAMSMSDRIVVMNQGRIEQAATPDEIYRHPASVFVADFIGRANFLDADAVTVTQGADGRARARVRVLGRDVEVAAHPGCIVGERVTLLVRPESMRIAPVDVTDRAVDVVGDHGRVLSAVFYGEHVEYEVETEYGTVVVVVPDPSTESILAEGDAVTLDFVVHRAWLLPAPE
ncbi:ABC transporter ATP-binding protein [Sanguibacter sp. A247]|uniref:ABC transporter ATP-binding protein n=1 Tax=unclassified Sanguibacter TaxID=2645534 RepID=UPI003FD74ABB